MTPPTPRSLSFTHPSRSRSDLGSFRRQETTRRAPRALDKKRYASDSRGERDYAALIADSLPPGASSDLLRRGERCGALPVVFPASNLTRLDDVRRASCLVDSVVLPVEEP